jgi:hypothetical protein
MAQWSRRRSRLCAASGLAVALAAATPARADSSYVGDMPIFASPADAYDNSGATVWSGTHSYATISNRAGASILNQGTASGAVVTNGGVVRNAPGATWNGDIETGANVAGAEVVNQGQWNGVLNNAGGAIDNSGIAASVNNASGVFANEGRVRGDVANGGQATNSAAIEGNVVNSSIFVNNAAGSVAGGLADTGSTTNNGTITGGVTESGAFANNASGVVTGGFALTGGSAVNNGEIDGGAIASAGAFTDNGLLKGGATVSGAQATFTVNGAVRGGASVEAGSLIVNSAGTVTGHVANAANLVNAGTIDGSVANSGAFVNNGLVSGAIKQTNGQTTNNGAIAGGAAFAGGVAVNNGAIAGATMVGAKASLVDNGAIGGALDNWGLFTENATGVVKGAFSNGGAATINGDLAGGATNSGEMVINASGHVENGLVANGGSTSNAGVIAGGAVVNSGVLTATGVIEGGLADAGLVKASGTISGPIAITGQLVIGDGAANGARLTIAPGSMVRGVITMPVDLSTGASNFLSAKGAALNAAGLDLSGKLVNANGAYWGSLSLSDSPIALTDASKAALAAASGPLYQYSDPTGQAIVQTINPGLGVTASQVAIAATTAFTQALSPPPADFERAPADPTPNLGAGAVWSRGFGASLTLSGDNNAGTGPAFDATRLSTALAAGEIGVEYGLHNIENSGLSLRIGAEGGAAAGRVTDNAGSGASGAINLPFVGAYATLSGLGFTGRVEARYNVINMQLTDAPLAVYGQSQRAAGMSYVAEASYRIPAGALYVEPSAGLSLSRLAIDDEPTNVGDLSFGLTRLTLGHAGLKIGGDFASGALAWRPYAMASAWRESLSGATIAVPQGPTITPTALGSFAEIGLGATATLAGSGFSGFGQGAWAVGPRISGLAATGGLRLDF